jgi:RNA polymerase sigma-70 factor (ECF subfamily)
MLPKNFDIMSPVSFYSPLEHDRGCVMTDGQLVRQALAGETPAFEALVRRWSPRVLGVCHARVGRAAAAEDLAQETLLRGMRALPTLADPEKFGPWLCGIASRACLDWLKKSERSEVSLSRLAGSENGEFRFPATTGDAADAAEHADDLHRLMAEVERLPAPQREVLMLYYYEDCTYHELAQRLGVSAATINARLTQARMTLRDKLQPHDKPLKT